ADVPHDLLWLHDGSGVADLTGARAQVTSRYVLSEVEVRRGQWPGHGVLVSAVGRNANVTRLVAASGIVIDAHLSFADHHPFTVANLAPLAGRHVLTTAKDWP